MPVFGLELVTEPKQNSKPRLIAIPKLTAVLKPMAEPKLKLCHVLHPGRCGQRGMGRRTTHGHKNKRQEGTD